MTMKSPPTSASGDPKQLAFDPAGTHAEEGPFMVKYVEMQPELS